MMSIYRLHCKLSEVESTDYNQRLPTDQRALLTATLL